MPRRPALPRVRGAEPRKRRAEPRVRRAQPRDAATLIALQSEFYLEDRLPQVPATIRALRLLLRTPSAGAIWLIEAAPASGNSSGDRSVGPIAVGYIVLTLGWSLELGGRDAFIDELYVRREWRGRGLGTLALTTAEAAGKRLGVRAVHLEVDTTNETARRLYQNNGYRLRDRYNLMLKRL